jgi:hypothetical protein
MPLDPTHVRLKLLHACDQWHFSWVFTPLTGWHCELRQNTEGRRRRNTRTMARFEQEATLEDAIAFHAFTLLEVLPCM